MYDDLQPWQMALPLSKEELLSLVSPLSLRGGIADGGHDLAHVATELGVASLDVPPSFFGQDDATSGEIERRGHHQAIVPAGLLAGNALLETCP